MPDVSRVEYDAALKRVRTVAQCLGDPCPCPCICKSFTLAALGLDEPPTEEEGTPVSDAKAIYENLPPEAVAAAAAFIRGLFYNQGEDYPLETACRREYRYPVQRLADDLRPLLAMHDGVGFVRLVCRVRDLLAHEQVGRDVLTSPALAHELGENLAARLHELVGHLEAERTAA